MSEFGVITLALFSWLPLSPACVLWVQSLGCAMHPGLLYHAPGSVLQNQMPVCVTDLGVSCRFSMQGSNEVGCLLAQLADHSIAHLGL